MEKLMKSIYVGITIIMAVCAAIITIVSFCRLEWISLFWLLITVAGIYAAKGAFKEYHEQ